MTLWCRVCGCSDLEHDGDVQDDTVGYKTAFCLAHGPCWAAFVAPRTPDEVRTSNIWTGDKEYAGKAGRMLVKP